MALVKVKPTSPGRRAVVQVVNANLHKGKPFAALTESKSQISKRIVLSISNARRTVFLPKLNAWNTIQTGPQTLH